MNQGFSLTFDPVFKIVFGAAESEGILASMLNAVLGKELDTPIEQMWFLPQEYGAENSSDGRVCRMDIVAKDQIGRIYDVEMQRGYDSVFNDRLFLYVSRLVTHYTPKGTKEVELQKVIGLSFGEQALPGLEDCPSPYVIVRVETDQPGYRLRGALPKTLHVNMPLVRKLAATTAVEDFDERLAWCYHIAMEGSEMTAEEQVKVNTIAVTYPDIEKAHRRYVESLLTDNDALQLGMLQELNAAWKIAGEISTARKMALEEGHAEGHAQGLAEGHAEGHDEGLVEGRLEGLREGHDEGLAEGRSEGLLEGKLEAAKAMKARGFDLDVIADCTGLCKEQLEAL